MVFNFFCIIGSIGGVEDRGAASEKYGYQPPCNTKKRISGADLADFQTVFVAAYAKWGPVAILHRAFTPFFLADRAADIRSEGIGSTQSQGKNKSCNLLHLLLSMLAIAPGNRVRPVVRNFIFACYKIEYRPHLF